MRIYSLSPFDTDERSIEYRLLRTLKPHTAPVVTSTVDRTGTLLATGGADGIVKVWDIRGGFITHTFHGHSGLVTALHFFEIDSSAAQHKEQKGKKRKQSGGHEIITNDETTLGYRLASGGEDGKVRVWNLHKRSSAVVLDSHVSIVRALDYSRAENCLLSGSRDKTVMAWDVQTWKNRLTVPVLEDVETAGFLADGAIIYTGGENANLRLWSITSGKELTVEQEPGTETEAIQESVYFANLPFLVTVHADQTIALHDTSNLQLTAEKKMQPLPILRRICGTHGQIIDLAYVGEHNSLLALATNSDDVRIISVAHTTRDPDEAGKTDYFGADVALLKGHEDTIVTMDADWSGHWLATGAKDNTARIWRIDSQNSQFISYAVLTGHAESVTAVSLPRQVPPADSTAFHSPWDHPPAFLITGSNDKTIKRWDIQRNGKDGKKTNVRANYTRKAHDKEINAIDTHHSSQFFATASQDRTVKIWSVEDGSTLGVLRGHRRGVWSVAFSPHKMQLSITGAPAGASSRGYVVTGSGDKTVRLWNLLDYSCLLTMEGHTDNVLKVLWLPAPPAEENQSQAKRGHAVASAAADGLVRIWDAQSGECSATLDNHADRVWALTCKQNTNTGSSAEEESLVSGDGDGVITFWRDTTSETAATAREKEVMRVETDQRLDNLIHSKNYREAIVLALQLDQPFRLLSLFKSVAEAPDFDHSSFTGSTAVDAVVASLADEQIFRLLLRCRDWNTNARNALVAQRVLRAVVESFGLERLASLKVGKAVKGASSLPEILRGLRAYGERHYARITDLWDETFMLEFTLREMNELGGDVVELNGFAHQADVVMIE
jgi:U3 small nucleolar RNA-associated protein 13